MMKQSKSKNIISKIDLTEKQHAPTSRSEIESNLLFLFLLRELNNETEESYVQPNVESTQVGSQELNRDTVSTKTKKN